MKTHILSMILLVMSISCQAQEINPNIQKMIDQLNAVGVQIHMDYHFTCGVIEKEYSIGYGIGDAADDSEEVKKKNRNVQRIVKETVDAMENQATALYQYQNQDTIFISMALGKYEPEEEINAQTWDNKTTYENTKEFLEFTEDPMEYKGQRFLAGGLRYGVSFESGIQDMKKLDFDGFTTMLKDVLKKNASDSWTFEEELDSTWTFNYQQNSRAYYSMDVYGGPEEIYTTRTIAFEVQSEEKAKAALAELKSSIDEYFKKNPLWGMFSLHTTRDFGEYIETIFSSPLDSDSKVVNMLSVEIDTDPDDPEKFYFMINTNHGSCYLPSNWMHLSSYKSGKETYRKGHKPKSNN